MLNINSIRPSNANHRKYNGYDFPTIDFKFQNTGTSAAFLWQFIVDVIQAEIDPTPVLNFSASVENNALLIEASNCGWGAAHNCQIRIDEVEELGKNSQILSKLFVDSVRQFNGTIGSGERKRIIYLTKEFADSKELRILGLESRESGAPGTEYENLLIQYPRLLEDLLSRGQLHRRLRRRLPSEALLAQYPEQHPQILKDLLAHPQLSSGRHKELLTLYPQLLPYLGKELGKLNAAWSCIDDKGNKHDGEFESVSDGSGIALTGEGFYSFEDDFEMPRAHMAPSDTTYISIVDPSKGPQEIKYSFSRKIPLGDIDRFHIMIGAPISCHLLVQFKFFIDNTTVIESEVFDIHISNTRCSHQHTRYVDGQALGRDLEVRGRTIPSVGTHEADDRVEQREDLSLFDRYRASLTYEADHYYNEGRKHFDNKQYEEAIAAFEQALILNYPHNNFFKLRKEGYALNPRIYYYKALALYNLEQYEEALTTFEDAIHIPYGSTYRNLAQSYYYKGKTLEALGRSEEAQRAYRQYQWYVDKENSPERSPRN